MAKFLCRKPSTIVPIAPVDGASLVSGGEGWVCPLRGDTPAKVLALVGRFLSPLSGKATGVLETPRGYILAPSI